MSNERAGGPGRDKIEITAPNGSKREIVVPSAEFIIGRDRSYEVPINDEKASKRHAQIRFNNGVYTINDLTSLNGTYLAGQKLLPGNSDPWVPNKELRIGSHTFRLIPNQSLSGRPEQHSPKDEVYITLGEVNSAPSYKAQPMDSELRIELSEKEQKIVPGQPAIFTATLTNLSALTAHYDLRISGLPEEWISFNPGSAVQLMPPSIGKNKQQQNNSFPVMITITPPPNNKVRAGRFKFKLQALKDGSPVQKVEIEGRLVIQPVGTIAAEIQHSRIPLESTHRVLVTNNSNAPRTVTLRCQGETKELEFNYKTRSVTIAANDREIFEFGAKLRKRRWVGGEKSHRFKATVESDDFKFEMNGEFVSRGVVPSWLPPAVVLLAATIGGLIFRNYQNLQASYATATATAITATAVMNVTETAVSTKSTATAVTFANSQAQTEEANQYATGTAVANATGTETWLQADSDRDGVINRDELEKKLDPNSKDTDEDGRDDGEELNGEVKTDPLKKDSDGDELPDGEELRRGLNPNSKDTDNDGGGDNIDPDPLHLPTSTPTPTETPNLNATQEFIAQQTREALNAIAATETKNAIGTQTAEAKETQVRLEQLQQQSEATRQQAARDATGTEDARQRAEQARAEAQATNEEIARQQAANAAIQTSQAATIEALRNTPTPAPMRIADYCQHHGYSNQNLLDTSNPYSWQCVEEGFVPYTLTTEDFRSLCVEQYGPGYHEFLGSSTNALSWSCVK